MTTEQMTAVGSLVIAFASLGWAVYQTLEKKRREEEAEKLDARLQQMEIDEKRYKLRPRLSLAYLETDVGAFLSYKCGVEAFLRAPKLSRRESQAALDEWLKALPKTLPFSIELAAVANGTWREFQDYLENKQDSLEGADHTLMFLLVMNEGTYPVRDVSIRFRLNTDSLDEEQLRSLERMERELGGRAEVVKRLAPPVVVDSLAAGQGILMLILHMDGPNENRRLGYELAPDGPITFADDVTGERGQLPTRSPYESARVVERGLLVRG
jgi:hypothetical protein